MRREEEMPEYLSVEVYSRCSDGSLSSLLAASQNLLEQVGYVSKEVETWLARIRWEPDGSGFGSSLETLELQKIHANGHALFAKPIVNGWTKEGISHIQQPWVSFALAFETQTQRQNLDSISSFAANHEQQHHYQRGVGKAIWPVMCQCANVFSQSLVYFTNEAQTGESWKAVVTGQEDVWVFEAALIPHQFSALFTPIPDTFAHIQVPEGMGFASIARWKRLPWEE
jgi:hypothetical protein